MIKAKELRSGNYLQGEPFTHHRLGLHSDGITIISAYGIYLIETGKYKVEPIPLTKDDWIKLGEETDMLCDKIGFVIFKNGYTYQFIYSDYPYKHQLQNLYFALTREELTIKE